jgi:hypothetical protein
MILIHHLEPWLDPGLKSRPGHIMTVRMPDRRRLRQELCAC